MEFNYIKNVSENTSNKFDDFENNAIGSRTKGLELDLRLREFEITQLTQRNNFFMIFQGVLIAGLVQSLGNAAPIIYFLLSFLGLAISILQVGMAGGAKYWQCRWEASTRSSEIAIVLNLLEKKKLAVQTFTLSKELLSEEEKKQVDDWNSKQTDDANKVIDDSKYIDDIVIRDIKSGKNGISSWVDWWVRALAIAPKWSVSRIPIWVGGFLSVFWFFILFNVVSFPLFESWIAKIKNCLNLNLDLSNLIKLVPLKNPAISTDMLMYIFP